VQFIYDLNLESYYQYREQCSTNIVADKNTTNAEYSRLQKALTTLADGRYEVTLEISAGKFEASGGGEESAITINDWVDVGVFGAEDALTGVPTTLYLQKHLIDSNQQQIVVTVDSEPVSVGIDPLNKLIDRNPSDNVVPAQ
jgi:hypothetical protein